LAGRPVRSAWAPSNLAGRSKVRTREAPTSISSREADLRGYWECRDDPCTSKAYVDIPALELMDVEVPGVVADGMLGQNAQRKPGTSRGSPRRSRTAKAAHISRSAMKLGYARDWGGSGRLSGDGPGQHNLDRSEDPWSRATYVARMAVFTPSRWSPT
jgi:hypothetical protein